MSESLEQPVVVVLCTVPSPEVGAALAERLVRARLAACVNLVPGITSFYEWDGAFARENELLLVIKTRRTEFAALRAALVAAHPYSVPEVIALSVVDGYAPYLEWVLRQTAPPAPPAP